MGRCRKIVFPTWHQRWEPLSSSDPWSGSWSWESSDIIPTVPGLKGWSMVTHQQIDIIAITMIASRPQYRGDKNIVCPWHQSLLREIYSSRKPVNTRLLSQSIKREVLRTNRNRRTEKLGETIEREWCYVSKRGYSVLKLIYCLWSKSSDMIKDIFEPLLRNQKDSSHILYWLQRSFYINTEIPLA